MFGGEVVVRCRIDNAFAVDDFADERGEPCANADFEDADESFDVCVALMKMRRAGLEFDGVLRTDHDNGGLVEVSGEVVAVELLERGLAPTAPRPALPAGLLPALATSSPRYQPVKM